MQRIPFRALVVLASVLCLAMGLRAELGPYDPERDRGPVRPAYARPQYENRVHDAGKIRMNFTNYGYFGNDGPFMRNSLKDPCPPNRWAPQCEFPKGSGQQYLFQAGLWIGSLIVDERLETKRVSVGTDGWLNPSVNEFWPGEGAENGIQERSTRPGRTNCLGRYVTHPEAVSDQDFICIYADTLTDEAYVRQDPIDGRHRPLGIRVIQKSYAFSQAFAEDFILIDYEIENIASNYLKNFYVGLYVDADCGPMDRLEQHTDDICGFYENHYDVESRPGDTIKTPIDIAWIADNDGRDPRVGTGNQFIVPHVAGTRVIRGPNPRLTTSFNWWISNGNVALDYGPTWQAHADSGEMTWTREYGTPMGDQRKYQVLSNGEFDFWQIMVDPDRINRVPPQVIDPRNRDNPNDSLRPWFTGGTPTPSDARDIANGYDTRYLLSWGPLGIRDYKDPSGRWIYRLNPGEKFSMTIAYVCGENFHKRSDPQLTNEDIDSSKFDASDLRENARWAMDVYDNRMRDTYTIDTDGDGLKDAGEDGWCGEDVGSDGIYTVPPLGFRPRNCQDPSQPYDSIAVWYFRGTPFEVFAGYYTGPDCDGTERNGVIDELTPEARARLRIPASIPRATEDHIIPEMYIIDVPGLGRWDIGWMFNNRRLDMGDGIPDFSGPRGPDLPVLLCELPNTLNASWHMGGIINRSGYSSGIGYELRQDTVILRWSKRASEETIDDFSRLKDFEGYRIHRATVNDDMEYELLAEFDRMDWAFFSARDSMMTVPMDEEEYQWRVAHNRLDTVINNIPGRVKPVGPNIGLHHILMPGDTTYEFRIPAHPLAPMWYAITAYDFGDPKSGLASLSTRPSANAVQLAPAGSPKEPVRVVPNPYRAYQDYTRAYMGVSWENMHDGTLQFFPQQDRRIEFINLPEQCLIRIYTVAGDLVQIIPHNMIGDRSRWASLNSERWDLNSRNRQQVVSGIYLFSVEDFTPGNKGKIETGKFVIIR